MHGSHEVSEWNAVDAFALHTALGMWLMRERIEPVATAAGRRRLSTQSGHRLLNIN
jgi:hypothetical protein